MQTFGSRKRKEQKKKILLPVGTQDVAAQGQPMHMIASTPAVGKRTMNIQSCFSKYETISCSFRYI